MFAALRPSIVILFALTLVTGVIYPLVVTGIAQVVFPFQANGSLVERDGKVVGSSLIAQASTSPKYFWPRPSATSPAYNGAGSGAANLGPTNPDLARAVSDASAAWSASDEGEHDPIPDDLVTTSASGLDPDISPAAAAWQVERVAAARGLAPEQVSDVVAAHTSDRTLGFLGEPRVNVLAVNLALDDLQQK